MLQIEYLFLSLGDQLLSGFHLLGDVALGVDQGLFANPIGGDFVFMRVGDFDIIPKDFVITHLQRTDSRLFPQNRG